MSYYLYFAAILLAMCSCNSKSSTEDVVEYSDGRQLLTVNSINRDGSDFNQPKIQKIAPDSVLVGEQFLAMIFLIETDLRIADAFVGCDNLDAASVDTVTYKVSGCDTGLIVKDDTILVAFRPDSVGIKQFPTITILTRDKEKVFRTMEYTFDYKVSGN